MDHFQPLSDALREAATRALEAHGALTEAMTAMAGALDAAVRAHDEHEDLRDTVGRLETLIMELLERDRRRNGGTA